MNRRKFIQSASGLFVAPAIVKADSIMRVSPVVVPEFGVGISGMQMIQEGHERLNEIYRALSQDAFRVILESHLPLELAPRESQVVTFRRHCPFRP